LKGAVTSERVTIKQLGGIVGELGLSIADQPTFTVGEDVLLFLEARPRDHTLYTAAIWQGKWVIETSAGGARVAVRREPGGLASDRRDMTRFAATVRGAGPDADAASEVDINRADARSANPLPFVLMSTPCRYPFSPHVDSQTGGQPGLAGGRQRVRQQRTNTRLSGAINNWVYG